jgi:hypothetical protein
MIPQDDHPDINFVGLLIGPRGNTLKCELPFFFLRYRNVVVCFALSLLITKFCLPEFTQQVQLFIPAHTDLQNSLQLNVILYG